MKRCIVFSVLIILILFSLSNVFAGGSSEFEAYYMPTNVPNNSAVLIELSNAKSPSASSFSSTFSSSPDSNNLALFRIIDTLYDGQSSSGVEMTISSSNGWKFVHEDNPTITRDFELKAFCIEGQFSNESYSYASSATAVGASSTKIGNSNSTSYLKRDGNTYKLLLPTTTYQQVTFSGVYPKYQRLFDVCISLAELDSNTVLESGYYTTEMTITLNYTKYTRTAGTFSGSYKPTANGAGQISQTITVRGYVGIDPGEDDDLYNLSVSSASDTYNMNLGIESQSSPYDVAKVYFYKNETKSGLSSAPTDSSYTDKYKVYISPTSSYTANGEYYFLKMNSENQARTSENTIYFTLCDSNGNSLSKNGGGNNTYVLTPSYSSTKIGETSAWNKTYTYMMTWNLNTDVYLKLTSESMSSMRASGLYYSYIYFTLVTN